MWRGDALADFVFDEFADPERVRLDELRRSAAEDRIEAELALGRHMDCLDELRTMVAAHPFRERLWGMLMLALYRAGRQADALRAFQDARRALGEELGIEPGPELRALEAAVLAQDARLDFDRTAVEAPAASVAVGNLVRPLTSCIGRDEEVTSWRRRWTRRAWSPSPAPAVRARPAWPWRSASRSAAGTRAVPGWWISPAWSTATVSSPPSAAPSVSTALR